MIGIVNLQYCSNSKQLYISINKQLISSKVNRIEILSFNGLVIKRFSNQIVDKGKVKIDTSDIIGGDYVLRIMDTSINHMVRLSL